MGDKTVSVRVRFEGGDQVKAGLQEVGREGQRAMTQVETSTNRMGSSLQNAGFQVSDFFVQVSAGTDPTRALAQQMPQLLQGFGLIGVAASVLVAALPSLWSLFDEGTQDAEALQKELDSVGKAVDAASSAAERAREPIESLRKKYGDLAESIRDARVQEAELRRGQATRAVTDLLGGLQTETGPADFTSQQIETQAATRQAALDRLKAAEIEFRAAVAAGDQKRIQALAAEEQALKAQLATMSDIRAVVASVASEYGITSEQASIMAAMVERVRESAGQGAAEQIAAASTLRDFLVDVYGSADAANEATNGLFDALNRSIQADGDLASIDVAGPIGAGADEAARLAQNLGLALQASLNYGKILNAGDSGPDAARRSVLGLNAPGVITGTLAGGAGGVFRPTGGRGGGGGGGGGADPDVARAKALTDQVRTSTEEYAIALEEVNRLKQKGLITDETYTRQLDKLNEKLGETGDLGKEAASAIRGAFDGLFDDPQKALQDLSRQLAMMALYQGLAAGFPSVFGSDGFLSLGVPGFAKGGMHRGGLRIVGENGPELEATGPSMIYPTEALRGMGRGGGGMRVEVHNYGNSEVQTEQRRGPDGEAYLRMMVGKDLASGMHDKSLQGRFGSKPQRVVR